MTFGTGQLRRGGALSLLFVLICLGAAFVPTVTRSEDGAASSSQQAAEAGDAGSTQESASDLTSSGRAGSGGDVPSDVRDLPDSIEVRFGDGRPDLFLPVHKRADGAFLRVGDLGRICGHGFVWDPDTYRGKIEADTVSVSFLLDSPIYWTESAFVQLPERVVYENNQLYLPLSLLREVIAPAYGERMVWDQKRGQLSLAAPRPWLDDIDFDRSGQTFDISIRPLPEGDYRLRWDPLGELVVEIRGLHLPPGQTQPNFRDRDVRRVRLEPRPGGMAVRISVDSGWVGAQIEERDRELRVSMTRVLRDVQRGEASLLTGFHPPSVGDRSWGARVVIEVSPLGSGSSEENRYLEDLASEIANQLEETYRHQVVFIPDRRGAGRTRGPAGTPEVPAVPEADVWIGLRMENYSSKDVEDFLFVVPGQPPRYETVGAQVAGAGTPIASTGGEQVLAPPLPGGRKQDAAYRMIPWGQAPRLDQDESQQLAEAMATQLRADLQFRPVRTMARSARIFRGLSMPSVLIYPTTVADNAGLRALSASDQVALVGGSLASGIDEFLRRQETNR
ncbi:MAG: hypothetical protein R3E97_18355 [Candidatus Eisenbacteria bacterium]